MTSKVTYLGDLRTTSVHLQSGTEVLSDAPKDNHGKGEAFSPSDHVANALGSCMLTIMGIKSKDLEIDMSGTTAEVTKTMQSEPRKISKIEVVINVSVTPDNRCQKILERVAITCPVYLSLHPDIEKVVTFNWN